MKGYWIATYRSLKNPENIKKYAEKATPAKKNIMVKYLREVVK